MSDTSFQFVRPGQVLELMEVPVAGNLLHLESPELPIPVKKQEKYNITRWAVTGRDDMGINTACWRIHESLKANPASNDDDWRELCYLWSSDFRTHITAKRWNVYREQLAAFERKIEESGTLKATSDISLLADKEIHQSPAVPRCARIERNRRYLIVETEAVKVHLNCRRGLAVDVRRIMGDVGTLSLY